MAEGTSAHNTVSIDNQDSSEVWSSFRGCQKAKPFDLKVIDKPDQISVSCHMMVTRLRIPCPYPVMPKPNSLKIEDKINGVFSNVKANIIFIPK